MIIKNKQIFNNYILLFFNDRVLLSLTTMETLTKVTSIILIFIKKFTYFL